MLDVSTAQRAYRAYRVYKSVRHTMATTSPTKRSNARWAGRKRKRPSSPSYCSDPGLQSEIQRQKRKVRFLLGTRLLVSSLLAAVDVIYIKYQRILVWGEFDQRI